MHRIKMNHSFTCRAVLFCISVIMFFCCIPVYASGEIELRNADYRQYVLDLGSADKDVRMKAMDALEKVAAEMVPVLLEVLVGDQWRAQYLAAGLLGPTQDPRALEPLIWATTVSTPETRRNAAWSLSFYHDPRATEALVKLLKDPEREVRGVAARALIFSDREAKSIVQWLEARISETDKAVLNSYSRAWFGLVQNPHAAPSFLKALDHSNPEIKKWGLGIILFGEIGEEGNKRLRRSGAVPRLLRELEQRFDLGEDYVKGIIEALAQFPDPEVIEAVVEIMQWPQFQVNGLDALAKLAQRGNQTALKPAIDILSGEGHFDRRLVGSGLSYSYRTREDRDRSAAKAARVIGKLAHPGDEKAVDALLNALLDESQSVRFQALEALAGLSEIGPLSSTLQKSGERVMPMIDKNRLNSGLTLMGLGDPRAVETLIAVLDRNKSYHLQRQKAARGLARLGDARAVEPLIRTFEEEAREGSDSERYDTLLAYAFALGKIGPSQEALEFLFNTYLKPKATADELFVSAYGIAVADRSSAGSDALLRWVRDERRWVREKAASLLNRLKAPRTQLAVYTEITRPGFDTTDLIELAIDFGGAEVVPLVMEMMANRQAVYAKEGKTFDPSKDLVAAAALREMKRLAKTNQPLFDAYRSGDDAIIANIDPDRIEEGIKVLKAFTEQLTSEAISSRTFAFEVLASVNALSIAPLPAIPEEAKPHMYAAIEALNGADRRENLVQVSEHLNEALRIAPWWAQARYNLALVLEALGEKKRSTEEFEYYFQLVPEANDTDFVLNSQ